VIVLGLPYVSVREVSLASNSHQPAPALRDLSRAADLNPFSATPGRIGGALALRNGQYTVAQTRFRQAIAREPGGWLGWLGAGLAASALGDRRQARRDFETAYSINSQQPAVVEARKRVATKHPLTSDQAFKLFVIRQ
jgi:Flp pilus assembly protein TadD